MGIPHYSPLKAADTLPAPAEQNTAPTADELSSEAVGIPPLRYQSRGEDAGTLMGSIIIETITPGSIRCTRSHNTISSRIPTGYSPGLQSKATILLTVTMPHGYPKGSRRIRESEALTWEALHYITLLGFALSADITAS